MDQVPIYILAGGQSSRFGSDKARALVRDRPLLSRLAETLSPLASRLTVVAERADKYLDLGLRTVADHTPSLGPLGGLQTALLEEQDGGRAESAGGWILITSCDWFDLEPPWIEFLLAARDDAAAAVAFRGQIWEPLLALYHQRLIAEVNARIRDGRLALWRLLEENQARPLPFPSGWDNKRQVNRREDLPPDRP